VREDQISVYLPGIPLDSTTFFVAIASPGPNITAPLAAYAAALRVIKIVGGFYLHCAPPKYAHRERWALDMVHDGGTLRAN
jgi:hypothetical protein